MKNVGRVTSQKVTRRELPIHLEKFAQAVAEGHSHVHAAEIAGRKRGSASYLYSQERVKERIAELREVAREATEAAVADGAVKQIRAIDVDRNDIIMGLADEARNAKSAIARVVAWKALADIFLLYAKSRKEIEDFHGWTEDELRQYTLTGERPERIRRLLAEGEGPTQSNEQIINAKIQ